MSGHHSWTEIRATRDASDAVTAEVHATPAPTSFYAAWWYLHDHPMFRDPSGASRFVMDTGVHVARVNPETSERDDEDVKNTKVEIWLETGPYEHEYSECSHDYRLDCGGDTYEDAIIALAANVRALYGDGMITVHE